MTHSTRALQSHDLSWEGIKLRITDILFLTTQGHGGPPRMSDQPDAGPPPRQHKHERQYTPSIQPFIPTRRIWNDRFPTFVLQVRKNPEKTSPRKPAPTGDRTRARCVTSAHATTCSTAVDSIYCNLQYFLPC